MQYVLKFTLTNPAARYHVSLLGCVHTYTPRHTHTHTHLSNPARKPL